MLTHWGFVTFFVNASGRFGPMVTQTKQGLYKMASALAGDDSSVGDNRRQQQAVTFTLTHLANDVVRIEALAIFSVTVAELDGDLPDRVWLSYPLSPMQHDAICEALRLVGIGEALTSMSVFDGFCRSVAPGMALYTVWLTG